MGEGEILDHGGRDGGGHGGEGHEGGGGGRVHEYYHPKTPGEIRIAARWQRLERERAEAENLLKSLDSQRKAWEDHYKGEQGLANARIRTWRVSSPTPYAESYLELRKLVADLNRLPPGDPKIEKIRLEKPGAYQLWQLQHTRGMRFRNVLWSLSLKRGINVVAKGWEALTKPFGLLGKLLNWPVQKAINVLVHPLANLPLGAFEWANPGVDTGQFAAREKALPNPRMAAHKLATFEQACTQVDKHLADLGNQMNELAGQYKWVHNLARAGGGH